MKGTVEESSHYYCNRACEYFPCHRLEEDQEFNCLFCYCPLYPLGEDCGGQFRVLPGGVKDCSGCLFPHRAENYAAVLARLGEVVRRFPCREGMDSKVDE